jgi:hypothetical protein
VRITAERDRDEGDEHEDERDEDEDERRRRRRRQRRREELGFLFLLPPPPALCSLSFFPVAFPRGLLVCATECGVGTRAYYDPEKEKCVSRSL